MPAAPVPLNETERLKALRRYNILDTDPEPAFDRITKLAARVLDVPVVLVSLLDAERQWFKSCYGTEIRETARSLAFCAYTVLTPGTLVVPDATLDPRFADNLLVTGPPYIRFYAGVPMLTHDGHGLGTLCLIDTKPRQFSEQDQAILEDLAAVVLSEMEQRRIAEALRHSNSQVGHILESMTDAFFTMNRQWEVVYANSQAEKALSRTRQQMLGKKITEIFPLVVKTKFYSEYARALQENIPVEFVDYSPTLKIWTEVRAFPSEEGLSVYFRDITQRKMAEDALKKTHDELEQRVQERTDELARTNRALHAEIAERLHAEEALKSAHDQLEERVQVRTNELAKANAALQNEIAERTRAEREREHLACHDALTGLPNRRMFRDHLDLALAHVRRNGRQLAVLFLDLDRFKKVNDSLGHRVGDLLLKSVTERLRQCLRAEDTVSRLGGDEFVVLLPEVEKSRDVEAVARKIVEAMRLPFLLDGHDFFITTSIGASIFPEDGTDSETLIKNADVAMYQAKDQGRNSFQLFLSAMNQRAVDRLALETSLHKALANDEFVVHYQPQVDVQSGEIIGMEALVRWERPDCGMVPPSEFIPLAEDTGLIVPIGMWVLRTACRQTKAWHDMGYPKLRVAVNLSLRQFQQEDLVPCVLSALRETGLAPEWLDLEITESIAMESIDTKIATLQNFRKIGINMSLDDFGTGYSSLNYLKRLPIDIVKIDQSFTRMITTDSRDAKIARGIISLAHSLKLKVIAEGVDRPEQAIFLKKHRCDTIQGYLFSPPVSAEAFTRLLQEGRRL